MKLNDLIESLNTKLSLHWQYKGTYELTSFTIGKYVYIIQIESKPLPIKELQGLKTAEVSFFLQNPPKGQTGFDTTNAFKQSATKIFGIVYNALIDKFDNYDAFIFTAKVRHSSSSEEYKTKRRIYDHLADRIAKSYGLFKYSKRVGDGQVFLVSKIKISLNEGWKQPVLEWISRLNRAWPTKL